MRIKEPPRQEGFEGKVVFDNYAYLWIWAHGGWDYLGDWLEGVGPGERSVFNLSNETVEHISLPGDEID